MADETADSIVGITERQAREMAREVAFAAQQLNEAMTRASGRGLECAVELAKPSNPQGPYMSPLLQVHVRLPLVSTMKLYGYRYPPPPPLSHLRGEARRAACSCPGGGHPPYPSGDCPVHA